MARNNRVQRRRSARRQSTRRNRKTNTRRIAHVATNGPVRVRVPNDPPMRSTTHERHYVIRFQINYDIDAQKSGWTYGNNNSPITYTIKQVASVDQFSVSFTVKELFSFHHERYGFDTGVAVALQSVKVWGPIPPTALRTMLYAYPINGAAPQSYEDVGTGVSRARVGMHYPILTWYTQTASTQLFRASFQIGDSSSELLKHDLVVGIVDVSFVARNNE